MAKTSKEKILVVESDPMVSDLIARQALGSQGYLVKVAEEAATAIQLAIAFTPDVVIANLDLPGLSGKDLMAALTSQNIEVPVVMIAEKGKEKDVIQAFRLGASDYVTAPVREAEVISVVERALLTVRARRERQRLSMQLKKTNAELQKRVDELTTIFSVGKAVTSITDQKMLFSKIVEGGVKITRADIGWLLLMDERAKKFILAAFLNLPKSLAGNLGKPWDDGISSLPALSGEPFTIHGDAMRQFQVSSLGKSAMVAPVKIQNQVIALLVVLRKAPKEFSKSDQAMLAAVSDYASISLVNARLFRALDEKASNLQKEVEQSHGKEKFKDEVVQGVGKQLDPILAEANGYIEMVLDGDMGDVANMRQLEMLEMVQQKLSHVSGIVQSMNLLQEFDVPNDLADIDIIDLAQQAYDRHAKKAERAEVKLLSDFPAAPMHVSADPAQIGLVFDSLLSNAVKFSRAGSEIKIIVEPTPKSQAHVSIQDTGMGISKADLENIFDRFYQSNGASVDQYGGLGIGLTLVKEIIDGHGGKVWVESMPNQGSIFHFTLLSSDG